MENKNLGNSAGNEIYWREEMTTRPGKEQGE